MLADSIAAAEWHFKICQLTFLTSATQSRIGTKKKKANGTNYSRQNICFNFYDDAETNATLEITTSKELEYSRTDLI